jgi:orotidine 5'-phosphate decarboxylase subfamily 1
LIDRRPAETGRPGLLNDKYPLFSVYEMEDLLREIKKYVRSVPFKDPLPMGLTTRPYTFGKRAHFGKNEVGSRLMRTMEHKKSNLILSADVTTSAELLKLADLLGPEICMIKTHMDILTDFNYDTVVGGLMELARKHNFLIMEDRKFADIGNTVIQQYTGGVHRIAEWADLVTVHGLLGEGIVSAFSQVCGKHQGIMLLAQLSNEGNLINSEYTARCVEIAEKYPGVVAGLICGEKLLSDKAGLLHCTPGVNMATASDKLDQRYHTPQWVIGELESDLVIVGRGIYQSEDPLTSARSYRQAAWEAYSNSVLQ